MDDEQALYARDTVSHIHKLLEDTFGDYFKIYFEGTPTTMPDQTLFPLVIIQKLTSPIVVGPTTADDIHETIQLTFALNRADDVGSSNERTTTMRHLQYMIEGQDPVNTNEYKAGTVAYVLRTYLTMSDWVLDSNMTVKYDIIPHADGPLICTADVTLETWRRVLLPTRINS